MKIMKTLLLILIGAATIGSLNSCKKENGASAEDIAKANDFKAFIEGKNFQISEYYSDIPIDYDPNDTVAASTDLWRYVSLWIKDDLNSFNTQTGKVTIVQGTHKIEGMDEDTLTFDFSIGADNTGAYFNFLNYQYKPLRYHLVSFTDSYFLVYVDWVQGSKVYTKFSVVN